MTSSLSRRWWALALRGVVYVIFGLTALLWPGLTFGVLLTLFGLFALVDGIVTVVGAVRTGRKGEPWFALLAEGVVSAAVGVLVFVWPAMSALVLLYVIGAWALLTGILEVAAAIRLRREIEGEWLFVLGGALSIVFGVAVFVWPARGALAIVWVLGAYAVLFGILLLALSASMWRHRPATPGEATPEARG